MDIICIEQLSVFTTIGVYDWEQTVKQKLLIDIAMKVDVQSIVENNKFKYYIDYTKVSQVVIKYVESKQFVLIEQVANDVANIVLNNFSSYWVQVKIYKLNAIVQAKQVSIIIERTKK
ncbi:MAG: bifunctional dihydroneopterin aldolase/7,8-dihydroneopterin epimerase [Arsenophonus endosymbiont of Ceratovacuna japonica]